MEKRLKKLKVRADRVGAIVGTLCRTLNVHPDHITERMYLAANELADTYLPINTQIYLDLKAFAKTLPAGNDRQNLLYVIDKIEGTK